MTIADKSITEMTIADRALMQANAAQRLDMLLASYHRLTGEILASDIHALWDSGRVVIAHDTQDPPRFFYGNLAALALFGFKARKLIGLPSYRTALPDVRAERAAMLARLEETDIVTGYGGVRVAADGSRFRISDAVIWNLRDEGGKRVGQAATFCEWVMLEE